MSSAKERPFGPDLHVSYILNSIGKLCFSYSNMMLAYIITDVVYPCIDFVLPSVFKIVCIYDVSTEINIFWLDLIKGQ